MSYHNIYLTINTRVAQYKLFTGKKKNTYHKSVKRSIEYYISPTGKSVLQCYKLTNFILF